MKAYHNDPAIKQLYIERVKAHRAADQLVKGQYWEDGKGCAVGCTTHGNDHSAFEVELGIPRHIAYLEDSIFEGLPNEDAMDFPLQFLESIQVGADLSKVYHQFMVWMLVDPTAGVIRFADERGAIAIRQVAELHQQEINGVAAWAAARAAAGDAARAAAWAAAWDAAGDAARAAARAAAGDAARAAAWAAAWDAARRSQRDKLLELLSQAE